MTEPPDTVRQATRADEDAIYDILVALHQHNGRGWGFPFRPEIVLARIETGTRPDLDTRTNPHDQRRGLIGVIDGPDRRLLGTVGLFLEPPVWFTDALSLTELWVFVRPEARGRARYYRDLFAFSNWAHEQMRANMKDYPLSFPLMTGFMHCGEHVEGMERLWRHSGAEKCGVLFIKR